MSEDACSSSRSSLEREFEEFDPMRFDFKLASSVSTRNDATEKNQRTEDIPCKFHDGFSGRCWKGATCHNGHKLYSGGVFAKENPTWSAAANTVREVTSIINLASEIILENSTQWDCKVVFTKSPSEFYVRPFESENRVCKNEVVPSCNTGKKKESNELLMEEKAVNMDDYFFGFNTFKHLEEPSGSTNLKSGPATALATTRSMFQSLNSFLSFGERYKMYQADMYFAKVELVAAKVNLRWNRALVQKCRKDGKILVKLLDTGEEIYVEKDEICRLPEKFCSSPPEVFQVIKCSLFGISPIMGYWNSDAMKIFREFTDDKDISIIVKNRKFKNGDFSILEDRPYFVNVIICNGIDRANVDLSEEMVKRGFAVKWKLI